MFLRARLERRYALQGRWLDAIARAKADTRPWAEEWSVRIVDDRPPPAPAPARVRHGKFGLGTVVREVEGGKLEIAFDTAGTRILQRAFVNDA